MHTTCTLTYTCQHAHVCAHTDVHIHTCIHAQTCMHTCTQRHAHTGTNAHTRIYAHTDTHVCTCTHTRAWPSPPLAPGPDHRGQGLLQDLRARRGLGLGRQLGRPCRLLLEAPPACAASRRPPAGHPSGVPQSPALQRPQAAACVTPTGLPPL